jgi:hypothetical protein
MLRFGARRIEAVLFDPAALIDIYGIVSAKREETMLDTLNKSNFDQYLNDTFEVCTESAGVVNVELDETSEARHDNMESFSVIFRGPMERPFEQRIHGVRHPKMGVFDLFLVPITYHKNDAMYYQAVFNRIVQEEA